MTARPRHPIPGDDPDVARLSEMVVLLLSELAIVAERLDTVERLLERAEVIDRADIEAYAPEHAAQRERDQRRARQIAKVLRPIRDEAEREAKSFTAAGSPPDLGPGVSP